MNRDLQALMKKRRKQMGLNDQQPDKSQQQKTQSKQQKSINPGFSQARKLLQANLFKPNVPKQAPLKPKQQIKVNSENIKNAKALLQANLNFGNNSNSNNNSNTGTFILPPPPSLNIPGSLPPPPTLPNIGLLPPPPSLPNIANLPPPPTLPNIAKLPPPPTLPNIGNLLPPPSLSNTNINIFQKPSTILPPPNILPPPPNIIPPSNILPPQSTMNNFQQQKTTIVQNKSIQFEKSRNQPESHRTSSRINQQQFRAYENTVKKENSIDKKKSIFGNQPMIRSSNKPISQSPAQQINNSQSKSSNNPKPIVLPSNSTTYQQPNNSQQFKPLDSSKNQTNNMPPKLVDSKQKKRIFQKQNSISTQFFGKDVAGFLKRQFLKNSDALSYIDKKLPPPKSNERPKYNFPSILQDKRGTKDQHFQPYETLYIDTKTLNVSGPFLVNNLNTIRDHNQSRQTFEKKIKSYDIAKDPQKLHLKAIKQLAQTIPSLEYFELNLAKIYSCIRKCDGLIKQKVTLKLFQQCQQIENLRKDLLKTTQKYCKYPQDCKDQFQIIERMMNKIRDIEMN